MGIYQPSWDMPMDDARRLMELNFFAALAMTQLVAPHMRARHSGMIVNVGSIGGKVVLPWMTLYSASKYALGALTEGLRMELMGAMASAPCWSAPAMSRPDSSRTSAPARPPKSPARRAASPSPPPACAEAIRRGVERDARTVVTPRSGWLLVLAMRLFPSVVEARMAAMNGTA